MEKKEITRAEMDELLGIRNPMDDLAQELVDRESPEFLAVVKRLFPTAKQRRRPTVEEDRSGIDVALILPVGPPVTIDWKFRRQWWPDIALEYVHLQDHGATRVPGWVETPTVCDFFGIVFKPKWEIWLLPREATQSAWKRHKEKWLAPPPDGYGDHVRSTNRGRSGNYYESVSCPVPHETIRQAIGGVRIATPTSVEIVVRDKREHYCVCGIRGGHTVDGGATWHCQKHVPG